MRNPSLHLSILLAALALLTLPACGRRPGPPKVTVRWIVGASLPAFDPDGPPHAVRWSLERWMSRGLAAERPDGRVVPDAAARWETSADGLTWTFHLRPRLAFTDGAACTSADFADALRGGLARADHSTRRWLLDALRGAAAVRAGRPLPALGIETPDDSTLVLRLARPEPALAERLSLPGVSAPWKRRATSGSWEGAAGLGPYRLAASQPGRSLTLVRADTGAGPDTLVVRFVTGAPRVRNLVRSGRADVVWPLPPSLLDEVLPTGWSVATGEARPARTLLLVMRADTPPTTARPAREAVAHALNHELAVEALGEIGRPVQEWPAGCGRFDFPALDAQETRAWLDRGDLGRSFHVVLGYDADEAGTAAARALQGEWARLGIDVELSPERGAEARRRLLVNGPQLVLHEDQPLSDRTEAALAALVMPLRGPAVGAVRTGWRTREFDPWIWPTGARPGAPLDRAGVSARLGEECMVLPLADLPWVWLSREGAPKALILHPRYGPACVPQRPEPAAAP
jgi:ABC-type transport system substrate-binding protein